jgi:hypothetical protein
MFCKRVGLAASSQQPNLFAALTKSIPSLFMMKATMSPPFVPQEKQKKPPESKFTAKDFLLRDS